MTTQYNSKGQVVHKESSVFTQAAVGYTMLSTKGNQACANCIFYRSAGFDGIEWPHCHIVENYPDAIEPTGYCNEWREKPEPPPDMVEAISEEIAEAVSEAVITISEQVVTMEKKPGIVGKIKSLFTGDKSDTGFEVFKGTDGKYYWHATYTNNYEDLDGEIITEKAHDKYITRLDMGLIPMPELWLWHTPGTKHGQAKAIWRNGHFIHAVGEFDDTPFAAKCIEYYRKNKVKNSHGFTVPKWAFKDGRHYEDYNTFEITTLPPKAAANPYTSFEELKAMALSEEKRRFIEAVGGKDKLAEIEKQDGEKEKALETLQIEYKEFANGTGDSETVVKSTEEDLRKVVYQMMEDDNTKFEMVKNALSVVKAERAERAADKAAFEKQIKEQNEKIAGLEKQLNMKPQRPSEAAQTIVDELTAAAHKGKLPQEVDAKTKALVDQFGSAIKVEGVQ